MNHSPVLFSSTGFDTYYAIMHRNGARPSTWQHALQRLIPANQNALRLWPRSPLHPTPTAPRVSLRLFASQRGQCGCATRPDWSRAVGLRAQAPASVTKGGSPARAPAACGVSGARRRILASLAMPNRRASRNAYYFFVQEKIPELRRRGLPVARVADAIPYCSADWAVRLGGVGGRGALGGGQTRQLGSGRARRRGGQGRLGRGWREGKPPCSRSGANKPAPGPPVQSTLPPLGPRALGTHCCFSPLSTSLNVPKLLREEEKEKYAEMAREWRAAQGRDAGPSEKQVRWARDEQLPAGATGVFARCWASDRVKPRVGWWVIPWVQRRIFLFFLPGVRAYVKKPAGSLTGARVVTWWWKAGGIPVGKPASVNHGQWWECWF